jgi:hypothetical protein
MCRFVQFYHDLNRMTPMEQACVEYNRINHGAELIKLECESTKRFDILTASNIKRFKMAIDDPWLRYADCDAKIIQWGNLLENGLPYFCNLFGNPDLFAIDFNGVNPDWIKKALLNRGNPGTIQMWLTEHWGEWKFLPKEWYIHKELKS